MAEAPTSGAGHRQLPVRRLPTKQNADPGGLDWVAVEEPLEIHLLHGPASARQVFTLAVTMRTPGDDEALLAGLLLTEGLIRSSSDLARIAPAADQPQVMEAHLAPGVEPPREGLSRRLLAGSACGVCGKTALEALSARSPWDLPDDQGPAFPLRSLLGLPAALAARQPGFSRTGGLHAAARFDSAGRLADLREDIGRHNALDKLVGAALLSGELPLQGEGLLVSGRASFELVQKARMAGCPLLAAVGAPSSLAVELAWEAGITLVGFLRDGRCNVYTGPQRVLAD
ncbi:MAG: formate dehydrogenase accessory sulfurtransferase FdhD [Chromatiales bacterium]|nr:formate dehydrogenase accessory sulfurtransferase FdhD [Chromatiales bacterium]